MKQPTYETLIPDVPVGNSETVTELVRIIDSGRLYVRLFNQAGYDCVEVDLAQLIDWYQSADDSLKAEVQSLILNDKKPPPREG